MEQSNIQKLEKIIIRKEKTVHKLNNTLKKYTEANLNYITKYNDKLVTLDFNTLINGRVTDAGKKAYIEKILEKELISKKSLENTCECLKNEIKIYDDCIRLYEYMIKFEQE